MTIFGAGRGVALASRSTSGRGRSSSSGRGSARPGRSSTARTTPTRSSRSAPGGSGSASYFPGQWGDPTRARLDGSRRVSRGRRRARGGGASCGTARRSRPGSRRSSRRATSSGSPRAERDHRRRGRVAARGLATTSGSSGARGSSGAEERDGRRGDRVPHARATSGILQKEVSLPFEPGTRLRWRWRVDALPSELPEDSALSHDYLSLAVEFERRPRHHLHLEPRARAGDELLVPAPDLEGPRAPRGGALGRGGARRVAGEERDLYADVARAWGRRPSASCACG